MAANNYEQDLESVKADLSALKEDIKGLVAAVSTDARDRIGTAAVKAKKYGKRGVEAVESQISDYPFASIVAAFGLGLVVGRLMNGK